MNPQVNHRLGYQVFTETESRRYRCQSTLIDMLLILIVFWPEAKSMVNASIHNYVSCVINRSRYKPKYMYIVTRRLDGPRAAGFDRWGLLTVLSIVDG